MKIKQVGGCNLYRDGGSLGLWFVGEDGKEYEALLQSRAFENSPEATHYPPQIFSEDRNNGNVVKELDWEQAKKFIDGACCDDPSQLEDFNCFISVIQSEGKNA